MIYCTNQIIENRTEVREEEKKELEKQRAEEILGVETYYGCGIQELSKYTWHQKQEMRHEGIKYEDEWIGTIAWGITEDKVLYIGGIKLKDAPLRVSSDELYSSSVDYYREDLETLPEKVVILDGIEEVCDGLIFENENLKEVVIADSVVSMGDHAFYMGLPEKITVGDGLIHCITEITSNFGECKEIAASENSIHFTCEDGVLYSKDMSILYMYPPEKEGKEFRIPSSVKKVAAGAFWKNQQLNTLYLQKGVELEEGAFQDSKLESVGQIIFE